MFRPPKVTVDGKEYSVSSVTWYEDHISYISIINEDDQTKIYFLDVYKNQWHDVNQNYADVQLLGGVQV